MKKEKWFCIWLLNNENYDIIILENSTTINIQSGYINGVYDDNSLIPIEIYGTNSLDTDEIQYIWKRTA